MFCSEKTWTVLNDSKLYFQMICWIYLLWALEVCVDEDLGKTSAHATVDPVSEKTTRTTFYFNFFNFNRVYFCISYFSKHFSKVTCCCIKYDFGWDTFVLGQRITPELSCKVATTFSEIAVTWKEPLQLFSMHPPFRPSFLPSFFWNLRPLLTCGCEKI